MSLEEQKKLILPFMQRAQEVEKADPKVAYYCRMYAVEQVCTLATLQNSAPARISSRALCQQLVGRWSSDA